MIYGMQGTGTRDKVFSEESKHEMKMQENSKNQNVVVKKKKVKDKK